MKFKMELNARNIINPEVITDFIAEVSKGKSDKIKVWCNTILKNYLKNEYGNIKEVKKSKKTDPIWLQEAVKRKDAQMLVIDEDFEILLIEHIFHYFDTLQGNSIKYSFSEADKQTKEWENKENLFNIKLTKGIKEILKCEGGYTWFEITEEETLYNEGEILQNCMRKKEHGPEYWKQIKKKVIKIFTLRDSKGIGHVGVEYTISKNFIVQMYGKQNEPPIKIYQPFCIELIRYLKCKVKAKMLKILNIVIDNDNEIYDIFNLPDNLIFNGDLDLEDRKIIKLPNNLKVKGDLNINHIETLLELPEGLVVNGDLGFRQAKITYLPIDLKIDGDLNLNATTLKEFPSDLKIGGSIFLSYSEVKKLPDNLIVNGDLNLAGSKIITLPNNLVVKKVLDITYTKIVKLPDDLKVKEIHISNKMKLQYIPKHLTKKIKVV